MPSSAALRRRRARRGARTELSQRPQYYANDFKAEGSRRRPAVIDFPNKVATLILTLDLVEDLVLLIKEVLHDPSPPRLVVICENNFHSSPRFNCFLRQSPPPPLIYTNLRLPPINRCQLVQNWPGRPGAQAGAARTPIRRTQLNQRNCRLRKGSPPPPPD